MQNMANKSHCFSSAWLISMLSFLMLMYGGLLYTERILLILIFEMDVALCMYKFQPIDGRFH